MRGRLNVLAIEVAAGPGARVLPLGAGLDDGLFEHDGQITKREVRALTLSALAPRRGELLLRHRRRRGVGGDRVDAARTRRSRAVAVEARADRAARIAAQRRWRSGCRGSRWSRARRRRRSPGSPAPDAVFLGGGGTDPGVLDAAVALLRPGGRLVANAVTLEMQALLVGARRRGSAAS